MDPRGRGLVPLAAIQGAAERYGYLVMSSVNTVSDNDVSKNELAFDAMITDAQAALALDPRRALPGRPFRDGARRVGLRVSPR